MLKITSRLKVARAEAVFGAFLVLLGVANFAWCAWSLPVHGVATAHGLETAVCNWGTGILAMFCIGVGAAIVLLGLIALWQKAVSWAWWACQIAIGSLAAYIVFLFIE